MSLKIAIIVVALVALAVGTIIFLIDKDIIDNPILPPKPGSFDNVAEANNQFAMDYYSYLKDSTSGNIFFSPFSISTALAMTYEGARGQTAEEMESVFYFPKDNDVRKQEYLAVMNEINKEDKEYELHTANALWAQEDYSFLQEYFDLVEEYYGGKVTNMDFKKNALESCSIINNWVEEKTNGKIKDLIPPEAINELTRLVLTNAVYFKGEWVRQFNEDDTREENFRISDNEFIMTPMMRRTDEEAEFNYAENNELQILEMAYSGEEISMLILLPKDDDLERLENSLSAKSLLEWKKGLKEQRVEVYIPKFKFETKYFMANDLKEMGMPIAFSGSADFSGMTGDKDLLISQVIHQAFVEVNEEGTEAAAATAVVMELSSAGGIDLKPKIPIFRANHPFIFLIQHNETGNILFMGRVINPNE
ncbi:serpin family protein [Patescibacteria group bacterium]|nr:serpin family protein [Patescibacteria group bacterium]MBU4078532.1 serpin family protein [Patescibacteria group bacterium]